VAKVEITVHLLDLEEVRELIAAAGAELEAQRQRYAELVRAATALCTHGPLGVHARYSIGAPAEWARERDARWLALRASLAALDSPCICSDIDVTSFMTPEGVRDVLRNVNPLCPEHGKGTRRVDRTK